MNVSYCFLRAAIEQSPFDGLRASSIALSIAGSLKNVKPKPWTFFAVSGIWLECQIWYGSGSAPSDQPMIVASSVESPVVSLVTRPWNASGAALALMPSCLYCSAATVASVSRSVLPEFVEIVRLNFLPAAFWRMPSVPGVQPASLSSCCALALSYAYWLSWMPLGYAHCTGTWCATCFVASPKTTALMTWSMSMPYASAWRTRLSARPMAVGLAVFQPMNV